LNTNTEARALLYTIERERFLTNLKKNSKRESQEGFREPQQAGPGVSES